MKRKRPLWTGVGRLLLFAARTVLIQCVDVQAVGLKETKAGFASWNVWFHNLTGVNMAL